VVSGLRANSFINCELEKGVRIPENNLLAKMKVIEEIRGVDQSKCDSASTDRK
jgi:hypothetical protein